jgi:hypothetical protein
MENLGFSSQKFLSLNKSFNLRQRTRSSSIFPFRKDCQVSRSLPLLLFLFSLDLIQIKWIEKKSISTKNKSLKIGSKNTVEVEIS